MRTLKIFVSFVILFAAVTAQARGGGNIMRGGLGFLFPDHNSFNNVGQFAADHGMAVEALYARTNQGGGPQTILPSFVYSNGAMGLGFYGSHTGTSLISGGS